MLPERCWPELDEVAQHVRAREVPITSLRPDRFELSCYPVALTA